MKKRTLGRRAFAVALFGIVAAISPVACRGLVEKPKPVLVLVYQVDPGVGDGSARALAAVKVRDVLQRRLEKLRLDGATVEVHDDRIAVGLPPLDAAQVAEVKTILSFRGKLELRMVDDEDDYVGKSAPVWGERMAAAGVEVEAETVSKGPGRMGRNHYASVTKRTGESLAQARSRLEALVKEVPPPPEREVGYGQLYERVEQAAGTGWRTYLLFTRAELGNAQIEHAEAVKNDGTPGPWTVRIRFTADGGRAFERLTEKNIERRLAIMLDGRVESAPMIQGPIRGGVAMITVNNANPETAEQEARKLELVLRSGALPAPIVFVSER